VNGLAFLMIALLVSVVGSVLLWLRYRKPRSSDAVAEFQREMRALSPDRDWQGDRRPDKRG
jgi:hypothetical protein